MRPLARPEPKAPTRSDLRAGDGLSLHGRRAPAGRQRREADVEAKRRLATAASPPAASTAFAAPVRSNSTETTSGPATRAAVNITASSAYAAVRRPWSETRSGQSARMQLVVAGILAPARRANKLISPG